MRLGVSFPHPELGGRREVLHEFGIAAEHAGYEHLLMYDHVVGAVHRIDRDPPLPAHAYRESDPFHDPFMAFSYLSAVTTGIEFITGVLVLPQRQTVLVARQSADLSLLSEGRLRLGVGWNAVEYHALGMDFTRRGRRIEEQIMLLRQLWSGEATVFDGEFDRVDGAAVCPAPQQQIPIFYGGSSDAALQRAARLADGFIFSYGLEPSAVDAWMRLRTLLERQGRDVAGFRAIFNLIPRHPGACTITGLLDALRRLQDAGATDATISSARFGLASATEHLQFIREIASESRTVLN